MTVVLRVYFEANNRKEDNNIYMVTYMVFITEKIFINYML